MAVCVEGVAARLKSGEGGDADTTRATVVEWLRFWLVPVTVSVELPVGVELAVLTVRVETPEARAENEAEALAGKPLALSETVPLKPLRGVTRTM